MNRILPIVLAGTLALCSGQAQASRTATPKIDEYSVNSIEVTLTHTRTGSDGTKVCVSKLAQVLRGAGVSVQRAQIPGDAKQSIGLILGNLQARLIVSGTCLSGGKKAVINVVNPFENKSAADLMKKIRAQF
ncbi:hypothetical protein [Deinococcus sp. PESE-13]